MLTIGPYQLDNCTILAPMAGVTDRPFRTLCREQGAALAVSEMVTSDSRLWHTRKSSFRLCHDGEAAPRSIQIAGADPEMMAEAARMNVANGAQIIDINMGCPAKKVCNKAAGSALLRDEPLVADIVQSVVEAVAVPVTLKIRTGWCPQTRNALNVARIAEDSGIQALTIHGRTRDCRYRGHAEYDTMAAVKQQVSIPVIANGDITSPDKAEYVLDYTGADAIMIGRGAQGNPWLFREINHYLAHQAYLARPSLAEAEAIINRHLLELHQFYGDYLGVRLARKHIGWYSAHLPSGETLRKGFNRLEQPQDQLGLIAQFFSQLDRSVLLPEASLLAA